MKKLVSLLSISLFFGTIFCETAVPKKHEVPSEDITNEVPVKESNNSENNDKVKQIQNQALDAINEAVGSVNEIMKEDSNPIDKKKALNLAMQNVFKRMFNMLQIKFFGTAQKGIDPKVNKACATLAKALVSRKYYDKKDGENGSDIDEEDSDDEDDDEYVSIQDAEDVVDEDDSDDEDSANDEDDDNESDL